MAYKVIGKCIYNKDNNEKVGCPTGDINKFLNSLNTEINETSDLNLKFGLDFYDYNSGQDYISATLKLDDKLVAYADLVRFEDKIYINFIESVVKGSGYGKELMRGLAKEYGYENLERSGLTQDGLKMRQTLDKEFGFDYEEHLKSKNKHLKLDLVDGVKNNIIKGFLMDNINIGYELSWEKWLKNDAFRHLNDLLSAEYDMDFNDVSSLSSWFIGSKTNDNDITDEPPHPVMEYLQTIYRVPETAINENTMNTAIKQLEKNNKTTLPKIPVEAIFFHELPDLKVILDVTRGGYEDLQKNGGKKFTQEKVNVKMIVPTQKVVNIDNLSATKKVGNDTGAELVKYNQFYFILDGHYRVANAILRGEEEIEAKVYLNTDHSIIKENLNEYLMNELSLNEDYPTSFDMDKFKGLTSFKTRMDYCKENLQYIAKGTSRAVFKVDETKVLKLAMNRKGIAQNDTEIDLNYRNTWYSLILADVIDMHEDSLWVEMELARPVRDEDFKRLVGYGIEEVIDYLYYKYYTLIKPDEGAASFYIPEPEMGKSFENDDDFINPLVNMMIEHIIDPSDFGKLDSYGLVNREGQETIVLIDFGLTNEVYETYY